MALYEQTLSPYALYKGRAEYHLNTAFSIVIQRIESKRAQTDGVLGAVATMALGERLSGNETAWNIHVDGVAQIIRDRHARGIFGLPPWFIDLLILFVSPCTLTRRS